MKITKTESDTQWFETTYENNVEMNCFPFPAWKGCNIKLVYIKYIKLLYEKG